MVSGVQKQVSGKARQPYVAFDALPSEIIEYNFPLISVC